MRNDRRRTEERQRGSTDVVVAGVAVGRGDGKTADLPIHSVPKTEDSPRTPEAKRQDINDPGAALMTDGLDVVRGATEERKAHGDVVRPPIP